MTCINNSSAEAQNFKFPYTDHSFDKVFLFSVFTHVSVNEIGNYLVEIKRVLKPGGLCLSTFFIYTDDEEEMISSGCGFYFPVKKENYRLMSNDVQSANIALNESLLNQLLSNARLEKLNTIHGYWKGKSLKHDNIDFHDVVIMKA